MCKTYACANVNMSVPKFNVEGHFTTYVIGSCMFWHLRKLKVGCCTSRLLIWKNILNYFG